MDVTVSSVDEVSTSSLVFRTSVKNNISRYFKPFWRKKNIITRKHNFLYEKPKWDQSCLKKMFSFSFEYAKKNFHFILEHVSCNIYEWEHINFLVFLIEKLLWRIKKMIRWIWLRITLEELRILWKKIKLKSNSNTFRCFEVTYTHIENKTITPSHFCCNLSTLIRVMMITLENENSSKPHALRFPVKKKSHDVILLYLIAFRF